MKKKKSGPIIGLLLTLLFFGVFIYWLITPSAEQELVEKIKLSTSIEEIKSLYLPAKSEFTETGADGNLVTSEYLQDAVREKLTSMKLNENEIQECLKWIPPKRMNLNLIVVPDLSKRIYDYPDQAKYDQEIINKVYDFFVNRVQLSQDSRDLLMIDVTDDNQIKGLFSNFANELRIDLSEHIGKSNRLFFTEERKKEFSDALLNIYNITAETFKADSTVKMGADYFSYFKGYSVSGGNKLDEDDFYNGYRNKILILTDGYLEAKTGNKISDHQRENWRKLKNTVQFGDEAILDTIRKLGIPVAAYPDVNLSRAEIMICEVRERKSGLDKDWYILNVFWKDWLMRMKLEGENFYFEEHANSSEETLEKLRNFIMK